jgi:hypothetical protein
LLELPLVRPLGHEEPGEEVARWGLETLAELTEEGTLALLLARPGYEAAFVQAFLDAGLPFALVLPQGLAAYEPPASLHQAVDAGRALLLSPFQPDWRPPSRQENPLLAHAQAFARGLAHALLALTPLDEPPAPGQPCFHPPQRELRGCEAYAGPEAFFLRLAESQTPTATVQIAPSPAPEPESPPLTPEEILATLAAGGRIPEDLAQRIRNRKPPSN